MWNKAGLNTRFILIIGAITLLLVGALSLGILSIANNAQKVQSRAFIEALKTEQSNEEELLRQGLYQKVESLAAVLSETGSYLIANYNFELLQQVAESVSHDPDIAAVTFYGESDDPLTPEPEQRDGLEFMNRGITYKDESIGRVAIGFNLSSVKEAVNNVSQRITNLVEKAETRRKKAITAFLLRIGVFSVIGVALLGLAIYLSLSRLIISPLFSILQLAEKLAGFDLTLHVTTEREDEVGTLFASLNQMVQAFRRVVSHVQHSGIQVTSSSMELSATAKEQETIITHQVESLKTVVSSVEQISRVSTNLVETMQHVASMSEQTAEFASSGQTDLTRMEDTMHRMKEVSQAIAGRLEIINEKTENITTVVTTISKVADQTNLLSLNAAIEAEKAGEYGRGFAVVAREIRRLADQTAMATLDIGQMVQEMQSAVSAGVMEMDKFIAEVQHGAEDVGKISSQLTRIIEQVQTLSPNFEHVNDAMQDQSENAQQINREIIHFSEEMENTKESLHETYATIEQLNEAARNLRDEVSRFKVE